MSREIRLGLFIVATLAALFVGIFWIGSRESLLRSTFRLKAQFRNVVGLPPGADVRVGGLQEGTVRHIILPNRPDGEVTVLMDLRKDTESLLRQDSVASIKSQGLVGDEYVEISFGTPDAKPLKNGDTVRGEPPVDIGDLFNKTNQILDTAEVAAKNVQATSGNLESISDKIEHGQGTVGALINDKSVFNQVKAGATAMDEDMEALKHNFLLRGFFNKRGYEDATQVNAHAIAKLPPGPSEKTFSVDAKKLFDKDTAKLKNTKLLNDAGTFLEGRKFGLAVVTATTGPTGDTSKDQVLAEARASNVREYLVNHFPLNDTRIKTIGMGKSEEAGEGGQVSIVVYAEDAAGALAANAGGH